MNQYDVVIIGAGRIGRKIAEELKDLGKKVAIVSLNDDSATIFGRTLHTLSLDRPVGDPNPHGPDNVDTYRGRPEFIDHKKILHVGDQQLSAPRFVIATGAVPTVPAVQGLDQTSFETPLSLFSKEKFPSQPLILGGGPLGVTLAFRLAQRKISATLISNKPSLLVEEEPELIQRVQETLHDQGISVVLNAHSIQVRTIENNKQSVIYQIGEEQKEQETDSLIVATGFTGNSKGFGFEKQGVYIDGRGAVVVNDQMRTSIPHIWAAGSVTGPPFHFALEEHQANLLINNITSPFFSQTRLEREDYPITYPQHPPLARLGLGEKEAREEYKDATVLNATLYDSYARDRSGREVGLIKLIGRKRSGKILGVHVIAPNAEDIILFLNLAKPS